MAKTVKLWDKEFELSYPEESIQNDVAKMAIAINSDLKNEDTPLFISVLNGSFMFTADLIRRISFPCEISFVKLASYVGTQSSETINELIGLTECIENRTVVIIEDVVDTGITLTKLVEVLKTKSPRKVLIATFLFKPNAYKGNIKIDYIGRSIPNDFIVGYGLDYNGLGRNLPNIYTLIP